MPRRNHTHTKAQGHKAPSKAIKVVKVAEAKREDRAVRTSLRVGQVSLAWQAQRSA